MSISILKPDYKQIYSLWLTGEYTVAELSRTYRISEQRLSGAIGKMYNENLEERRVTFDLSQHREPISFVGNTDGIEEAINLNEPFSVRLDRAMEAAENSNQ